MDDDMRDYEQSSPDYSQGSLTDGPVDSLPDISAKNTKTEIMKAYQNLAKRYEGNVKSKKATHVKQAAAAETVQKASVYTTETVAAHLEHVKVDLARGVDALAVQFTEETRKMEGVQHAIVVLEQKLKDLHDIEEAAVSIEDLIRAQEVRKDQFEAELARKRLERDREQEEYAYALAQQRKKDDAARQEREAELERRHEWLKQNEQEFARLQKEVEGFPVKLDKAIAQAKEQAAAEVRRDMGVAQNLEKKEAEAERRVLETRIAHFEATITKQDEEIVSLKAASERAQRQVQTIAEKSLEASSGKQTLRAVSDIAMHQAGGRVTENN